MHAGEAFGFVHALAVDVALERRPVVFALLPSQVVVNANFRRWDVFGNRPLRDGHVVENPIVADDRVVEVETNFHGLTINQSNERLVAVAL